MNIASPGQTRVLVQPTSSQGNINAEQKVGVSFLEKSKEKIQILAKEHPQLNTLLDFLENVGLNQRVKDAHMKYLKKLGCDAKGFFDAFEVTVDNYSGLAPLDDSRITVSIGPIFKTGKYTNKPDATRSFAIFLDTKNIPQAEGGNKNVHVGNFKEKQIADFFVKSIQSLA